MAGSLSTDQWLLSRLRQSGFVTTTTEANSALLCASQCGAIKAAIKVAVDNTLSK